MSKSEQGGGRKPPTRTPEASRSAVVATAAVDVRTLTLSGKQMTLAVFRQLPRAETDAGSIVGVAWGTVNYHPDPECKGLRDEDHLHVVSNDDGRLVRTIVIDPHEWKDGTRVNGQTRPDLWGCVTFYEEWEDLIELPQLFIAV